MQMTNLNDSQPPLSWLVHALDNIGINLDRLSLRPEQSALLTGKGRHEPLRYDDYLAILDKVGNHIGEPEIGLLLADNIEYSEMGLFGYLLLNTPTIREYLESAARYDACLGNHSITTFQQGAYNSRIGYDTAVPVKLNPKHGVTLALARRLDFIRSCLEPQWQPVGACFSFARPENVSEYEKRFGQNIHFDQTSNFIEIDNDCLEVAINDADPTLLNIMRSQAEKLIEDAQENCNFINRVKMELMREIGGKPSQEAVAKKLNLSRATLQRRLELSGKTFRQIRNEVIYQLATQTLSETEASIGLIAQQLGYSETSAFDRSFRRLSGGISPLDYRNDFKKTN